MARAGIWRRGGVAAAAVSVAIAIGGCGATVTVSTGPYWLVKVKGDYANVYRYPTGNTPGTNESVELGAGLANEKKHLKAAAKKLGIPGDHITFEAAT